MHLLLVVSISFVIQVWSHHNMMLAGFLKTSIMPFSDGLIDIVECDVIVSRDVWNRVHDLLAARWPGQAALSEAKPEALAWSGRVWLRLIVRKCLLEFCRISGLKMRENPEMLARSDDE
ncbi:MAG: hypothetical protein ACKV19_15275 [Verrucomicrobiales bacterium]